MSVTGGEKDGRVWFGKYIAVVVKLKTGSPVVECSLHVYGVTGSDPDKV